ncbi:hypothetical protein [Robertkochia flava]|uniref:hypothetical protein n=1 Tax=Robertkochia flava TaxID=3447986 RepID=UPI001CCE9197|nr:hypothetical protein [Robertkochia marina]
MKAKKILTLTDDGKSITINELTLGDQQYYFWFTGEFYDEVPKRGKGKLYPDFETLWDAFAFDPFQVFPEIPRPLPSAIREFLNVRFLEKEKRREMHVFLVERWGACLSPNAVVSEVSM